MSKASNEKNLINLKLMLITVVLTFLVGFGFSLRGDIEVPLEAQSIWLVIENDKNSPLQKAFQSIVKQNRFSIDEQADNQIIVTRIDFRKITTTLNADAEVDEYTLRGELNFNIINSDKEIIASNLEGFAERTFQYDANDAAASNSREAFLNQELWRTLSEQILRQYAARFRLK
jgi:outer membrane lipopolysaccharide assembly protein LptE/RlpB